MVVLRGRWYLTPTPLLIGIGREGVVGGTLPLPLTRVVTTS